jgi:DNA-binding transcriptional LysR family regulator
MSGSEPEPEPPAMRLDLFSLKLFVDIVELRSIGKGAAKNCIAVSAASKRMADLEHALGAQLLHRQSRGVVTTDAGETLYKGMTETLLRLQQVAAAVSEQAMGRKRPVRLCSNLTSLMHQLPAALKAFSTLHPDVRVELEEQTTAATLQAVSRGDADIGIVAPILPYPVNVVAHRFDVMRHVLVVPADHPLAAREAASFDQAAEHDFIGLESEGGWDQLLRKVAEERDCDFRVPVRVNSFDGLCRMVASGLGVAIVPAPTARLYAGHGSVRVLRLDEAGRHAAGPLLPRRRRDDLLGAPAAGSSAPPPRRRGRARAGDRRRPGADDRRAEARSDARRPRAALADRAVDQAVADGNAVHVWSSASWPANPALPNRRLWPGCACRTLRARHPGRRTGAHSRRTAEHGRRGPQRGAVHRIAAAVA